MDFSKIIDEVKKLVKRGAKVMFISVPGGGKTTRLILALLQKMTSVAVSLPYYETIDVLRQALPPQLLRCKGRRTAVRLLRPLDGTVQALRRPHGGVAAARHEGVATC